VTETSREDPSPCEIEAKGVKARLTDALEEVALAENDAKDIKEMTSAL